MNKEEGASDKAGTMLNHLKQMSNEISTLLKYDRTGESFCAAEAMENTEPGCSVLTPEQICSQLSMVLNSGGNTEPSEKSTSREKGAATNSNPVLASSSRKCRRERKGRKGEQPKRARDKASGTKVEKRPKRRLKQNHTRKGEKRLENSEDPRLDFKPSCPPVLLRPTTYVVEISPDKTILEDNPSNLNPTPPCPNPHPCSPPSTTVLEIPRIYLPTSEPNLSSPPQKSLVNFEIVHPSLATSSNTAKGVANAGSSTTTGIGGISETEKQTKTVNDKPLQDSTKCRPLNYDLLGRLIDEPVLMLFYRSFHSCSLSDNLNICLLDPTGEGSPPSNRGTEIQPKWLQVTQKRLHVDPHHGPVTLARLLVSNSGILKFQILFPFAKTVFTRLLGSCDISEVLSELSPQHVLCPGLPNYQENHSLLGFHPENVRILQMPDSHRYDHKHCQVFHRPRYAALNERQNDNMCTECLELQVSILRLIFTRFSRTEQEKRVLHALPSATSSAPLPLSVTSAKDSSSDGCNSKSGDRQSEFLQTFAHFS